MRLKGLNLLPAPKGIYLDYYFSFLYKVIKSPALLVIICIFKNHTNIQVDTNDDSDFNIPVYQEYKNVSISRILHHILLK